MTKASNSPQLTSQDLNNLIALTGHEWLEYESKSRKVNDERIKQYYEDEAKKYRELMNKLDKMYGVLQNE